MNNIILEDSATWSISGRRVTVHRDHVESITTIPRGAHITLWRYRNGLGRLTVGTLKTVQVAVNGPVDDLVRLRDALLE